MKAIGGLAPPVFFVYISIVANLGGFVMQHHMYAIKDKAAGAFLQPIFSVNENTAIRSLKASLLDPQGNFRTNAKDYSLYYIGLFDDNTGTLAQAQEPVFVVNCETLLASMEATNG